MYVQLRTDFVAGVDFASVETLLADEPITSSTEARRVEATASAAADYVVGERVAELGDVARGAHFLRVSLLAADRSLVIERTIAIQVTGDMALTVVLSRRCSGVVCPTPDNPASYTSCLGGRCVNPTCVDGMESVCGVPECATATDCPRATSCVAPVCADTVCLARPDDTLCASGEVCAADGTCVRAPLDGGVRTRDGGSITDGGPIVDGGRDAGRDSGTDGGAISSTYCPTAPVLRRQAAVYFGRFLHGVGYEPPPATGTFSDVPVGSPFAPWIEQMARDGLTAGCGGGMFCPDAPLPRGQAAVFFVLAVHGVSFVPPAATGTVFGDVSSSDPYAAYIEQLAADGLAPGCGGGNYCPSVAMTRAQAAVYFVRIAHGAAYSPPAATGLFEDVVLTSPEAPYIEQFARDGYSVGCAA